MLVCRHEHDRVDIDVEAVGVDGQAVKVELSEPRIWLKQVGSSQGAAGNHFGSVGTNWTCFITSASTRAPSMPCTIRTARESCPGSRAARVPLPGLIDLGTSRSTATSVSTCWLVERFVIQIPTESLDFGRKCAAIKACSSGGISLRIDGSMARSPSVVKGATARSASLTRRYTACA